MENKSYAAFLSKKFGFTICSDFPRLGERAAVAIKHFTTKRRARMVIAYPRPLFGRTTSVELSFLNKVEILRSVLALSL